MFWDRTEPTLFRAGTVPETVPVRSLSSALWSRFSLPSNFVNGHSVVLWPIDTDGVSWSLVCLLVCWSPLWVLQFSEKKCYNGGHHDNQWWWPDVRLGVLRRLTSLSSDDSVLTTTMWYRQFMELTESSSCGRINSLFNFCCEKLTLWWVQWLPVLDMSLLSTSILY